MFICREGSCGATWRATFCPWIALNSLSSAAVSSSPSLHRTRSFHRHPPPPRLCSPLRTRPRAAPWRPPASRARWATPWRSRTAPGSGRPGQPPPQLHYARLRQCQSRAPPAPLRAKINKLKTTIEYTLFKKIFHLTLEFTIGIKWYFKSEKIEETNVNNFYNTYDVTPKDRRCFSQVLVIFFCGLLLNT